MYTSVEPIGTDYILRFIASTARYAFLISSSPGHPIISLSPQQTDGDTDLSAAIGASPAPRSFASFLVFLASTSPLPSPLPSPSPSPSPSFTVCTDHNLFRIPSLHAWNCIHDKFYDLLQQLLERQPSSRTHTRTHARTRMLRHNAPHRRCTLARQ